MIVPGRVTGSALKCYHLSMLVGARRPPRSRPPTRRSGAAERPRARPRRRGDREDRGPGFRRAVEALAALLVLVSLYVFYRSVTSLGGQDYVAALLLSVVGIALMRSGVELARSALCE